MCDHDHSSASSNPSVHQTFDELEFDRSLGNAALCGEVDKVVEHLRKGTNVNSLDAGGYAPIHYAARQGHINIARLLLSHGGDVNIQTRSGRATALLRAAFSGKKEMCQFLIEKGADVKAVDDDGQTVLHRAVKSGHLPLVNYILEIAPELKTQADKRGLVPMIGDL
ncbi:hypothetical protein FOCC_FOCC000541 [Frankliniella occidentalis]|uniref:Ankyrin repeat domain-containing protein 39 isoform X1 n=1 Tax=Frankliniella occidentalis TaxID=133901 RepID=A0A9C6U4E9_FRAOC|nr:ankyrin repeat domain-containing protein 39 isoform X1 [Frankliniella occidentalis]XP_052122881.1 ankyrin repeat domain-containing protein 39 isoform X1 [Frankliniella occidentalis]KAE8752803.1 hypothetical protein FOCC_FOCC000541 [Frankliniella occidentalis]